MLPLGDGLHVFSTVLDAVQGATAIAADPESNGEAARQIAADYFAHDRALAPLAEILP